MAQLIRMPAVVADADDAVLSAWLVDEGQEIEPGQPIAEVETEKATVEVDSAQGGVLDRLLANPGESVKVGVPIAAVRSNSETAEDIDQLLSLESEDTEGAPVEGNATRQVASQEESRTDSESFPPLEGGESRDVTTLDSEESSKESPRSERRFASPLARRLAKQYELDLSTLVGSGPGGRIIRSDVERQKGSSAAQTEGAPPAHLEDSEVPAAANQGLEYSEEPVSKVRQVIARRLTESKTTAPHFYLTVEVLAESLMRLRSDVNAALTPQETKVTINDLLLKAFAASLGAVPEANATWHGDTIRYYAQADVGIAIATGKGLVVPVVRNVSGRGVRSVSQDTADLKERASEGKIRQDELKGGSFSISNLGMYGIREFSAIINPPHAGILALGAIEQRPVVDTGQITVKPVFTATLSADHRVVDGAVAARLLANFKEAVEDPLTLLL